MKSLPEGTSKRCTSHTDDDDDCTQTRYPNPAFHTFRSTFTRLATDAIGAGGSFALASALQMLFYDDNHTKLMLEIDLKPHSVPQPALVVWGTRDRSHARTDRRSVLN